MMEIDQVNPALVHIEISLLPSEVSTYQSNKLLINESQHLNEQILASIWDRVRRKWGFSIIREVNQDQPDEVQLRITQVEISKPGHRAGLIDGDIIYQLYGCCTNPPLPLVFGLMRDSYAFEMTVIRSVTEKQELKPVQITGSSYETSACPLENDLKKENTSKNILRKKDPSDINTRKSNLVDVDTCMASFPLEDTADSPSCIEIVEVDFDNHKEASMTEKALPNDTSLNCSKDIGTSSRDISVISNVDNAVISLVDTDIVTAIPPSVVRQSTFDYGYIVTSKSRMAGLKTKQSSKLKRLYPDSSLFIKRILKYHPPQVILKDAAGLVSFYGAASHTPLSSDHEELPPTFESAMEMRKLFAPILLAEGISSLKQEFLSNSDTSGFWTRTAISLQLLSCIPVDPTPTKTTTSSLRTFEMTLELKFQSQSLPISPSYGELYVLYSSRWKESGYVCLGIAGYSHHTFLTDQKIIDDENEVKFRVWVCVSDKQFNDTGWLADFELPQPNADGSFTSFDVFAINIGTVADILRQYEGITSIANIRQELQDVVYCRPMDPDTSNSDLQVKKPSTLPSDIWETLLLNLNPYQASTVSKIMNGNQKGSCFLLQGPPGTGKTATIVGLVGALLNGNFSTSSVKASGTKVQVGSTMSKPSTSAVETPVSSRILLCAPSNQSVDDLAWKVQKYALGLNGKQGVFNLVRVGALVGEERHDGRGKMKQVNNFSSDERTRLLRAVNLDVILNEIASGREVKGFDTRADPNEKIYSSNKRKRGPVNTFLERQKILSRSHVVCSTLSGAGSRAFIEACARDDFPEQEFDVVIIDEACQASESISLIPFKFNPNLVIIVGDPQQLPVTILSKDAKRLLAHRSLFERLQYNNWPVHMLKVQYRMHDEIAAFPSEVFYGNELVPSDSLRTRNAPIWYQHPCFPPYLLWDIGDKNNDTIGKSGSYSNKSEVRFILDLLREFRRAYGKEQGIHGISIGIITFYNDQVQKIKDMIRADSVLNSWFSARHIDLMISTVDGFQGRECDIVILSCVRARQRCRPGNNSKDDIGFLRDFRRLNVAITRAKFSFWIVGQCSTLELNPIWAALVQNGGNRRLIARCDDFRPFSSPRLSISAPPHEKRGRGKPSPPRNQGQRKKKNSYPSMAMPPVKDEQA